MKLRVVLDSAALGRAVRAYPWPIERRAHATLVEDVIDGVRFLLAGSAADGKCRSLVVAVHVDGEGCDHE